MPAPPKRRLFPSTTGPSSRDHLPWHRSRPLSLKMRSAVTRCTGAKAWPIGKMSSSWPPGRQDDHNSILAKSPISRLNFREMAKENSKPLVGILMGSDSDWPTMKLAADALAEFGIASEAKVISAHRDPHGLEEYVGSAASR